jgi:sec-independent protein translocase protein TatA
MPFMNGGHIWLILGLIVLLVIFGPGKLPELGTAVGKTIKAFRKSTEDLKVEMSQKDVEPVAEALRGQLAQAEPRRTEPTASEPARGDGVRLEG